ncbi:hypothetical protein Megpolyxen_01946 (plasmid) [Candidatus Megaera polyxenophila]|nr:hypothetical protein Megpolyxen_01946 [Candidatus Megaera polyxenophila]
MGNYDYFDESNSYYGVCLNCGSARCGYYGGCTDREKESDTDKEDNNECAPR